MRFFIDAEFIEDGKTIDLISIGIVAEDGREYYALNFWCEWSKASQWVGKNVMAPIWDAHRNSAANINEAMGSGVDFANIDRSDNPWRSRSEMAREISKFMGAEWVETEGQYRGGEYAIPEGTASPEIWGEWCSYDWVVFCGLFGTMMDLPTGFPMRCRDVVQFCEDELRLSTDMWPKSLEVDGNHNALLGAKTVKARYQWCCAMKQQQDVFVDSLASKSFYSH